MIMSGPDRGASGIWMGWNRGINAGALLQPPSRHRLASDGAGTKKSLIRSLTARLRYRPVKGLRKSAGVVSVTVVLVFALGAMSIAHSFWDPEKESPGGAIQGIPSTESLVPSGPGGLSSTSERRWRDDESRAVDSGLSRRCGPHRSETWATPHLWGRIPSGVGRSSRRGRSHSRCSDCQWHGSGGVGSPG